MLSLEEMQSRLATIPCPICKKSHFLIGGRNTHSYAENLYTARCADCAYTFQVSTPTRPIKETDPDIAQWLGSVNCPACHTRGTELNFRCTPSVRDCYYFVTCTACRHAFHEKAPMEAFE